MTDRQDARQPKTSLQSVRRQCWGVSAVAPEFFVLGPPPCDIFLVFERFDPVVMILVLSACTLFCSVFLVLSAFHPAVLILGAECFHSVLFFLFLSAPATRFYLLFLSASTLFHFLVLNACTLFYFLVSSTSWCAGGGDSIASELIISRDVCANLN